MHPDIGIVRIYRRSDIISMIPGDQNTLTRYSSNKNGATRDPLPAPVSLVINVKICSYPKLIKTYVVFILGTIFQRFELSSP